MSAVYINTMLLYTASLTEKKNPPVKPINPSTKKKSTNNIKL